MTISNGFELDGGEENVRVWLMDWCEKHNFLQTLRVVAWDMMVYGNAYQELCSDEALPPELWWLKALDPCFYAGSPRRIWQRFWLYSVVDFSACAVYCSGDYAF